MDIIHTIIDNEGEEVNVTYADGSQERAIINELGVQDESLAILLDLAEEEETVVYTCDFENSDDVQLTICSDREIVQQFENEGVFSQQECSNHHIIRVTETKQN